MRDFRLIVDPPAAGAWNMAVDEALLNSAAASGQPTLRFYRWQEPTLSLGYFQQLEDRHEHPPSLDCELVRRVTGGGAILHDRELTYSFTLGIDDRWGRDAQRLYALFHETLAEALDEGWGIRARLCGAGRATGGHASTEDAASGQSPFLCFQRRSCFDLLVGEDKIAGSAQRRRRQAILQHGSVLLAASPRAPELPGLAELSGCPVEAEKLIHLWQDRIQHQLGVCLPQVGMNGEELAAAHKWQSGKFSLDAWVARR